MKQTFTLLTTLLLSVAAEAQTTPAKAPSSGAGGGKTIVTVSKSTPELPRKSEGDVVELTDGRLVLPDWRMQDVIDLRVAVFDTAWFYGESDGASEPQDIEWSIAEALPNSLRPPDGMMYPNEINLAGPRAIAAGEPLRCWLRAVPPAVPLSYDGVGRRVELRPELRVELLDAAGTVVAVERPAFPQATVFAANRPAYYDVHWQAVPLAPEGLAAGDYRLVAWIDTADGIPHHRVEKQVRVVTADEARRLDSLRATPRAIATAAELATVRLEGGAEDAPREAVLIPAGKEATLALPGQGRVAVYGLLAAPSPEFTATLAGVVRPVPAFTDGSYLVRERFLGVGQGGAGSLMLPFDDPRWISVRQEVMNGFLREVRAAMDEAGRKRGRPVRISVRLPATKYDTFGFDPQTWIREGLVDVLIPAFPGWARWFDIAHWTAMAKGSKVEVWPGWDYFFYETASAELTDADVARGLKPGYMFLLGRSDYLRRAAEAYAAGADGFHTFNAWGKKHVTLARGISDAAFVANWRRYLDPENLASEVAASGDSLGCDMPGTAAGAHKLLVSGTIDFLDDVFYDTKDDNRE